MLSSWLPWRLGSQCLSSTIIIRIIVCVALLTVGGGHILRQMVLSGALVLNSQNFREGGLSPKHWYCPFDSFFNRVHYREWCKYLRNYRNKKYKSMEKYLQMKIREVTTFIFNFALAYKIWKFCRYVFLNFSNTTSCYKFYIAEYCMLLIFTCCIKVRR